MDFQDTSGAAGGLLGEGGEAGRAVFELNGPEDDEDARRQGCGRLPIRRRKWAVGAVVVPRISASKRAACGQHWLEPSALRLRATVPSSRRPTASRILLARATRPFFGEFCESECTLAGHCPR
jgi:hypothetical protein